MSLEKFIQASKDGDIATVNYLSKEYPMLINAKDWVNVNVGINISLNFLLSTD